MTYRLHPAAAEEHLDSVAFYESRTPGLGADYLAEFEVAMRRVVESPQLSPIEVPPEIRIAYLQRFPFSILFRVGQNEIQVLAIAHQRRRPRYWLGRK